MFVLFVCMKRRDKRILVFDLEANQPSGKIIEIGWVVGSLISGEILSRGSCFVNPNEDISEYITELTGITNEDVSLGVSLVEAFLEMNKDIVKYKLDKNLYQWGGYDLLELKKQLASSSDLEALKLNRYTATDVHSIYRLASVFAGRSHRGGLSKAVKKVGLQFVGKAHRGLVDAENTFNLLIRVLEELRSV